MTMQIEYQVSYFHKEHKRPYVNISSPGAWYGINCSTQTLFRFPPLPVSILLPLVHMSSLPHYPVSQDWGRRRSILCRIVSFDKLQVVDIGITRNLCELTDCVLQQAPILPLSRVMSNANEKFISLPQSSRLSSYRPFRTMQQESHAAISEKIRRESVNFLRVYLMGLSNCDPDSDRLLG